MLSKWCWSGPLISGQASTDPNSLQQGSPSTLQFVQLQLTLEPQSVYVVFATRRNGLG